MYNHGRFLGMTDYCPSCIWLWYDYFYYHLNFTYANKVPMENGLFEEKLSKSTISIIYL